jgi:hypothetical protein
VYVLRQNCRAAGWRWDTICIIIIIKLQLSGSGCGMGEKDAKMWGQHIYWSLYRGGLPGSGTSQGAVAPRSEILISVGWSSRLVEPRKVNSSRTVRVTGRWYSCLAELFRSRGSPPPWPARCPVVPPRDGAGLVAE